MQEHEVMEWEEYDSRVYEEPGRDQTRSPWQKPANLPERITVAGEAQEATRNPFLSASESMGEAEMEQHSERETGEHDCNCGGSRKSMASAYVMPVRREAETPGESEMEFAQENFETSGQACAGACVEPSPGYEKTIRRRGDPKGAFIYRTEGDPKVNLAIQLYDYDVNAYYPIKERHAAALGYVSEFVLKRLAETDQPIAITISGLASRTGTAEHNAVLSCNRAKCVADNLRLTLEGYRGFAARVSINSSGQGFTNSICRGKECELGEFRSVLVQVHAPGNPPQPIPPVDPGWDKYTIRCCSFETTTLLEGLLGDLLKKEIPNLPAGAKGPLLQALRKGLQTLSNMITKNLPKLGSALRGLTELLDLFPAEFIEEKGVFQIRERGKNNPREQVLCYTGRGLRLLFPVQNLDQVLNDAMDRVPGLKGLPEPLKKEARQALKKAIPESWQRRLQPIASKVPGPPLEFTLKHKRNIGVFKGPVQLGEGIWMPGRVNVEFDSPVWHSFISERPHIDSCPDAPCPSSSGFQLVVGRGDGLELFAITAGSLVAESCACDVPQRVTTRLRTPQRLAIRRETEGTFATETAGELEGEPEQAASELEGEQLAGSFAGENLSEEWKEGEVPGEALVLDPYASIRSAMAPEYASLKADELRASLGSMPATLVLQQALASPATRQALNAVLLGKAARRSIPVNGADIPVSKYFKLLSRLCCDVAQQADTNQPL